MKFLLACSSIIFATCLALPSHGQNKSTKKKPKNPAMLPVKDIDGLPRVLLIGDSISIGYTTSVRKHLEGKANVHRPLTNCGPTIKGLESIEQWLATGGKDKKWDLIHFNWGLHDLKYMGPNGENLADPKGEKSSQQVAPKAYEANLRKLAKRLQKTEAKLIWRNTTPVPEGAKGRVVGDAVGYNKIAAKVMKELNIPTHDLYSIAKKDMDSLMKKANVHFTTKGSETLAVDVVKQISAQLGFE